MPFTFSHPALVLPLAYLPNRWFSLTGLVVGSLTPDFEYFIRMRIQSDYSHTLSGLFWFDLPLGILLAFLFHNIVRNSLFDNLPGFLRSRVSRFKAFNWNSYFRLNWVVVLVSLLIGAASHIFWDAFTHDHGYFVERKPFLTNTIHLFEREVPVLKILQHSSSLLGAMVVVFALFQLPSDKQISGRPNSTYWLIVAVLTLLIVLPRVCLGGLDYHQYGHLLVTGISAGLISLIVTPFLLRRF